MAAPTFKAKSHAIRHLMQAGMAIGQAVTAYHRNNGANVVPQLHVRDREFGSAFPVHIGVLARHGLKSGAVVSDADLHLLLVSSAEIRGLLPSEAEAARRPVDLDIDVSEAEGPFMTDDALRLASVRAAFASLASASRDLQEANKDADPVLSMVLLPMIEQATALKSKACQLLAALTEKSQ